MRKSIFLFLIYIWVGLSFIFLSYNFVKLFKEIKYWYFLSSTEKKEKIFGDKYKLIEFTDSNIDNNSSVYLLTDDVMTFFLTRYYLYPRNVYLIHNENEINKRLVDEERSYLVSEKEIKKVDHFVIVASNSAKNIFIYKTK